jgi:hypothetical protein
VHEFVNGTFETSRDVRSSVAIRGKADVARTAHFGSRYSAHWHQHVLRLGFNSCRSNARRIVGVLRGAEFGMRSIFLEVLFA